MKARDAVGNIDKMLSNPRKYSPIDKIELNTRFLNNYVDYVQPHTRSSGQWRAFSASSFFHEKFQCEKIQLFMGYTIFPYALKLKKNRNLIILNATFPVFFHLEFVAGSVKPLKILRAHNTQ